MVMPGRKYPAGGGLYRFGFNGQMKSTEINENSYTAEFWEYNAALGRRWNVDPKPNPYISNYATFANNPIFFADPLGDTTKYFSMAGKELGTINNDGALNRVKVEEKLFNIFDAAARKDGKNPDANDYVTKLNGVLDQLEATGKYGDLISRETGVQNLTFTGYHNNKTHLSSGILSLNTIFDNGSSLSINQWDALSGTVGKGGKILHPLPNRNDYVGTGIDME
ncbi:MAG: hypothetical protein NTZ41_05165 [Sphingobacteriales bacterium]|nr:hypothetical protein [Sphingobacteriales bacterium]